MVRHPRNITDAGLSPAVAQAIADQPYLPVGGAVELGITGLGRQRQRFVAAP